MECDGDDVAEEERAGLAGQVRRPVLVLLGADRHDLLAVLDHGREVARDHHDGLGVREAAHDVDEARRRELLRDVGLRVLAERDDVGVRVAGDGVERDGREEHVAVELAELAGDVEVAAAEAHEFDVGLEPEPVARDVHGEEVRVEEDRARRDLVGVLARGRRPHALARPLDAHLVHAHLAVAGVALRLRNARGEIPRDVGEWDAATRDVVVEEAQQRRRLDLRHRRARERDAPRDAVLLGGGEERAHPRLVVAPR